MKMMVEDFEELDEGACLHERSLLEAADLLKKLADKWGKDARLKVNYDYSGYILEIWYFREETDDEYRKRLKREEKAAKAKLSKAANARSKQLEQEAIERALYESLKAKYEPQQGGGHK